MGASHDPPPPPLASDVAASSLQCQLAAENMCVAASGLLSLIRTLRLSLMLTDDETIGAEEEFRVERLRLLTASARDESDLLEREWVRLRNGEMNDDGGNAEST